ncbi:unnamed protein product [Phaedon cochleariae]|uniref:Uncharacterized protein n=1 Tax=Phaedon cochleariae TaxID=80249 RepID=A0A9N9X5V8_PHACE|nr:unnamed protein product [Phaedon cochleariae]
MSTANKTIAFKIASHRYRKIKKQIERSIALSDMQFEANCSRKMSNEPTHESVSISVFDEIEPCNTDQSGSVSISESDAPHTDDSEKEHANVDYDSTEIDDSIAESETESIDLHSDTSDSGSNDDLPVASNIESSVDHDPVTFLSSWALKNNVTHTALSELLSWFSTKPDIYHLPLDARTLLKTPVNSRVEKMGKGEFYYFGLKKYLDDIFKIYPTCLEMNLDFGIDGLPLHKSTNLSFWPVICKVNIDIKLDPTIFTVSIYCGSEKPPPLEEYFEKFTIELKQLLKDGITGIENKIC